MLLQKPDAVASIFKVRVKGIGEYIVMNPSSVCIDLFLKPSNLELDDLAEGFRQMLEMVNKKKKRVIMFSSWSLPTKSLTALYIRTLLLSLSGSSHARLT